MRPAPADERSLLRRRLRAARRLVPDAGRVAAAAAAAANLARLGLPKPYSRVAVYVPMDGELDPAPVIALARERRCEVYVPVITSFRARRMRFAPLVPGRDLRPNRWGIHEPEGAGIDGRWLDLALVPCVAFDAAGNRLGLGAGFYDRHFAFLSLRDAWRRPLLVGLAYELQRVAALERRPWDVPLAAVVTEAAAWGRAGMARADHPTESPT